MKAIHSISKSLSEQAVIDGIEEVENTLSDAIEELIGLRESLIAYQNVTDQIWQAFEAEIDKINKKYTAYDKQT